jgi:hypothetical protein
MISYACPLGEGVDGVGLFVLTRRSVSNPECSLFLYDSPLERIPLIEGVFDIIVIFLIVNKLIFTIQ